MTLAQTKTAAFRKWFGPSVVTDAAGAPLIVWHGSPRDPFDIFDRRAGTAAQLGAKTLDTLGVWFGSREAAEMFAGRSGIVYGVYLSIANPFVARGWTEFREAGVAAAGVKHNPKRDIIPRIDGDKWRRSLMRQGYDGVYLIDGGPGDGVEGDYWAAFEPTQIKHAKQNDGTFNLNDPSMLSGRRRGKR